LNNVSRNLSLVGRTPGGGVPFKRRLLNLPEMIRIVLPKPELLCPFW